MKFQYILATLFVFFSLQVYALNPSDICDENLREEMAYSERTRVAEVCSYLGQYEDSLLPDTQVVSTKAFREGSAHTYDYHEFFQTFGSTLKKVQDPNSCDSAKTEGRVAYPTVSIQKTATGTIPVSVIKEDELNQIFKSIASDAKYAFEVIEDGCWARAHIIARELEKKGLRVGKIFAEGTLAVRTPKALDGQGVMWSYHVAPVIAVDTGRGVEMRVIDPALFEKPVPVKTWTDKMLPHPELKKGTKIYMTDRFVVKPLRGENVKSLKENPSRGRWSKFETVLSEQQLEQLELEGGARELQKSFYKMNSPKEVSQ